MHCFPRGNDKTRSSFTNVLSDFIEIHSQRFGVAIRQAAFLSPMPLNDKDYFDRGKFLGQVQCYYVNKVKKDD